MNRDERKRRANSGPAPQAPGRADDHDLWQLVTSRVEPLRKAKARVPDVAAPASAPATIHARASFDVAHDAVRAAKPRPAEPRSAPAPRTAPVPGAIDRRKQRRIARGLVEIDARLDLHGLTQAAAERRLRSFLTDARAHGLSTVLVITGKGGPADPQQQRRDGESERGVLRRAVPLWLETPGLREIVVGYAAAHVRHGGAGAIYIHLRKRERGARQG